MESKISPYPTWTCPIGLARFTGVRWLGSIAVLASATALGAPQSNPAFLGIRMEDARASAPMNGCRVVEVTPSSAAEAASLRHDDIIQSLDGVATASCNQLTAEIVAHAPGDVVKLEVLRHTERITLHATLSTRAELLHHKLVGHKLDTVDATNVDDGTELDLAELHGEPTILAWFNAKQCSDCPALVRRLGDNIADPHIGSSARLLAVTPGSATELASYHLNVGAPLVAVGEREFEALTTNEWDRVFIMVLDRRGHVCFVTPIMPSDDSVDAAMDEVLAAAEQAEHARARR